MGAAGSGAGAAGAEAGSAGAAGAAGAGAVASSLGPRSIRRAIPSPPRKIAAPAADAALVFATSPHVRGAAVPPMVSIVIDSPWMLLVGTRVLLLNFITNSCISP